MARWYVPGEAVALGAVIVSKIPSGRAGLRDRRWIARRESILHRVVKSLVLTVRSRMIGLPGPTGTRRAGLDVAAGSPAGIRSVAGGNVFARTPGALMSLAVEGPKVLLRREILVAARAPRLPILAGWRQVGMAAMLLFFDHRGILASALRSSTPASGRRSGQFRASML
jgi:hypothetical protein